MHHVTGNLWEQLQGTWDKLAGCYILYPHVASYFGLLQKQMLRCGFEQQWFISEGYQFSMAPITNYHNIYGLKQTYFLSYSFEGQKFEIKVMRLNSGCSQGHFISRGSREDSASLPFQLTERHSLYCLYVPPSTIFKANNSTTLASLVTLASCSVSNLYLLLIRTFVTAFRAHPHNPGYYPHLKIIHLIIPAKSPLPNQAAFTGLWIRTWIFLGAIFWPTKVHPPAPRDSCPYNMQNIFISHHQIQNPEPFQYQPKI